ncbi:MAG: excinuclease ABC subunit UvrA [Bacteroidia bacterium]|nr:excinuclease ABC subunit UvrA [Bacteroidia bacterium]
MSAIKPKSTQNSTKKDSISSSESDTRHFIEIKGARSNNLRNIDVRLPKNQLIVVTGVSGSGKSSLTMDTLYAEGQRRYVESLSSYARQFLMRMKKPEVDLISGICPAIAIEQKVSTSNARSTVGTLTEVYDYLRLLYARVGRTYSPASGQEVKRHQVQDVVDAIMKVEDGQRIQLYVPLMSHYIERSLSNELILLLQKGYTRIWNGNALLDIQDFLDSGNKHLAKECKYFTEKGWRLLIDRFAIQSGDEENIKRIADSINTAFYESGGDCIVDILDGDEMWFNNRFELDGIVFLDPSPNLFNYNNPYGACPVCEGFGKVMGIDENKVIPDMSLSVYEEAVQCWKGESSKIWLEAFIDGAQNFDFPIHRAYKDLTEEEMKVLWEGNEYVDGINLYFETLQEKLYKIQNRVLLSRYRGKTKCHSCKGGRLRKEATYVKIGGKSLDQLVDIPIKDLLGFFDGLKLNKYDAKIGQRLLYEITSRLRFMEDVGLSYLTLGRISSTLSGGETQRINLTRTLGNNLTSSMYILDEPSIGLHPRDTGRLIKVLKSLRNLGNTVIVVEHEEDIISSADYLLDIGPMAGIHGGQIVYAGPYKNIYEQAEHSLTTAYMSGTKQIPVPKNRRKGRNKILIQGARQHNLKDINVTIPLNAFTVVSGVSGSGKTTLIKNILYPALKQHLGEHYAMSPGNFGKLEGDLGSITQVEMVNQNPIGRSSRSNPVTYVKAYDAIRKLMSDHQLSKLRGYQPKHFSFNVDGGRCETCKGEGEQVIEMQFLADIKLECEDCKGRRFKQEILEIAFNGKNISEILKLTVEEALQFFADSKEIYRKLKPLDDVGLGYITLGQSSSTLSGGEAQRVKLASYLGREKANERIFFIFDEPTTGLHFHDINKLLIALNALVEQGHSVLVIEHNLEVIKSADWLVDLGPEGGEEGGFLVFEGQPEDIVNCKASHTGKYLTEKL